MLLIASYALYYNYNDDFTNETCDMRFYMYLYIS